MQYGAFTIPYICCFVHGVFTIPCILNEAFYSSHSWLLFVACYISHHKGMYKSTRGTFSSRFHHFIISLNSWGTTFVPIVIYAALIYPTFSTHGHLDFSLDCPKIVPGPFSEISVSFLFSCMDSIYFYLNYVFSDYLSMHHGMEH